MKSVIDLNGIWKFTPTYDQKPTNNHNVVEADVPLYAHPRLVRTHWEDVRVPGVWQCYAEKYSVFEGVCWFFREFEVGALSKESLARLVCKGINYKADIYINGHPVGVHESAYTEFSFEITRYLHIGVNVIAIQVDNRPTVVKWPNDWGYGVYGGIHRDIFIELYCGDAVYEPELTPDYCMESGCGILSFCAKGTAAEVQLQICDTIHTVRNENGRFSAELTFMDIQPWSPECPRLYTVTVSVGQQVYAEYRVGFRNVACRGRQLLLNGLPVEMKGGCYLCDSPESGLALSRDELEADLLMMKKAHINAVRTHYPMSDDFYSLCDDLGLMVWIEPNIYCSKPHEQERETVFCQQEFVDTAVRMTEEMVFGARRFASVVIYGIGNECNTEHPEALPFFEKIAAAVWTQDRTRPIGYASLYGQIGNIAHLIDVMGINSYYGWYGVIDPFDICDDRNGEIRCADVSGVLELISQAEEQTNSDTVLLLTEFGADSVPGYLSPECALWSENYHAQVVEKYITAARTRESVSGYFVFAFTDYKDPSKPLNGRWNGWNLKGMLTYDRTPKLPFWTLERMYR